MPPVPTTTAEPAPSSRELALRAGSGDVDAFAQLYGRYSETVFRYVYYRVDGHALAEDLSSETFLRAYRGIGEYSWQGRDFGAWLVTIARNLIADHYKSGRYRLEICTADLPEPFSSAEDPERVVIERMTHRRVLTAVRDLGGEQRECLVLRFLHGLTVAETAVEMGKRPGAVKTLQYRAVRSLARMLPTDVATF